MLRNILKYTTGLLLISGIAIGIPSLPVFKIKPGTTGARPTGEHGQLYANSTTGLLEYKNASTWTSVVSTSSSDILTNKTIDADLNTITNIENADIKSGAAIARDKLASGTADHVVINSAAGVMTSEAALSAARGGTGIANNAAATLTRSGNHALTLTTTNTTGVTLPTTGTLATLAGSETFTNKTLTNPINNGANSIFGTASNTIRLGLPTETTTNLDALTDTTGLLAYDSTQALPVFNNGSGWTAIGTGASGGGTINYVAQDDAEATDISAWTTYDDGAAAPVDGLLGTVTSTWTRSTSTPLRGVGQFIFTKDAVNRIGEGVAYPFTVSNADLGKVLQISFDYKVVSGTYADDDLTVYIIQDPSGTPVVIQPAPYLIKNHTTGGERWFGEFQTSSSVTSYALLVHVKSASALAYVVAFDNFIVGPQAKLYGSPVTDWVSYTPVITTGGGTMTNYTATGYWRRVGDEMELKGQIAFTGAAGTWSDPSFSIPSGTSINTSKIPTEVNGVGDARMVDSGTNHWRALVNYASTTTLIMYQTISSGSYTSVTNISQAVPFAWASPDLMNWTAKVPISGWGSQAVMSDGADTRVVFAQISGNPASATAGNIIIVPTVTHDTHGAYNVTTGRYTCATPGYYKVYGSGISAAAGGISLRIYKDAVANVFIGFTDGNGDLSFTGAVHCTAGQILDIRPDATLDATSVEINYEKISGPSQIMASEVVEAHYSTAAGQSIESGGAGEIIDFGTKITDSHNAVTVGSSWKFTMPRAGTCSVKVSEGLASSSGWAATEESDIILYKNGAAVEYLAREIMQASFTAPVIINGSTDIKLIAGDYINILALQNNGATIAMETNAYYNYVSILCR